VVTVPLRGANSPKLMKIAVSQAQALSVLMGLTQTTLVDVGQEANSISAPILVILDFAETTHFQNVPKIVRRPYDTARSSSAPAHRVAVISMA
jgi:hypothetical protein